MRLLGIVAFLLIIIGLGSCGESSRNLRYLQGPLDSTAYASLNYKEPVIQPGDILSIAVFSDNPVASSVYNQASSSPPSAGTIGATSSGGGGAGYLVDYTGNIQFHTIGILPVKGLTRNQLASLIADKLKSVLMNPYCQVRFSNFKITVLGEVKSPSVFSIPSEKVSILEVLGLAGDLTDFARRDSILVIREFNNERKFGWLDMRSPNIFGSDFFYLQRNDVVIVRPTDKKSTISDQILIRNLTIATSIISTIAIVVSLIQN